jgi:hypothetical protein
MQAHSVVESGRCAGKGLSKQALGETTSDQARSASLKTALRLCCELKRFWQGWWVR